MNTVAHLCASFAARTGKELFLQDKAETSDQKSIKLNIRHAILIKETSGGSAALKKILADAAAAGLKTSEFTREMLETSNDKKVIAQTKEKSFDDVEHLGILIFGPKSIADDLSKEAKLAE